MFDYGRATTFAGPSSQVWIARRHRHGPAPPAICWRACPGLAALFSSFTAHGDRSRAQRSRSHAGTAMVTICRHRLISRQLSFLHRPRPVRKRQNRQNMSCLGNAPWPNPQIASPRRGRTITLHLYEPPAHKYASFGVALSVEADRAREDLKTGPRVTLCDPSATCHIAG